MKSRSKPKPVQRPRKSWCDIETAFPPSDVMDACGEAEADIFSLEASGSQAENRRKSRALAALLEFTDLRVPDGAKMLHVKTDQAWWLRRKWMQLQSEQRQSWLTYIHKQLSQSR